MDKKKKKKKTFKLVTISENIKKEHFFVALGIRSPLFYSTLYIPNKSSLYSGRT